MSDRITIAILAKDKSHCLPLYLKCIEKQIYPKNKISIYIRSNNNNDNTVSLLQEWVHKNRDLYEEIYEDYTNVKEKIEIYKPHDWNEIRYKILGEIRQKSLQFAIDKGTHYFVIDCDNFVIPTTLQDMHSSGVGIVGPLLASTSNGGNYSNYHEKCNSDFEKFPGYFKNSTGYFHLLNRVITSLVSVDVIHCTYFIRNDSLSKLYYDDDSKRHEYVIFSDSARKSGILQFLDTRKAYGKITFADDKETLEKEPWFLSFSNYIESSS